MRLPFDKMHGLGNDFVVIDARAQPTELDRARIRAIADRKTGVGCDQLILLGESDIASLKMQIFNADGSEAEACGNAARCITMLQGGSITIETSGGVIQGSAEGEDISIDMGVPKFGWEDIPLAYAMDTRAMPVAWDELTAPDAVNIGNPHIVFCVEDAQAVALDKLGPIIEADPLFPEKVNVNVMHVAGPNSLQLRVWERGAGLTRACGTGACATAVTAIRGKRVSSPVTVSLQGGELVIDWAECKSVRMTGPATHVFRGELVLDEI